MSDWPRQGLEYGAGFRGLKQLWRDGDEALGVVELREALRREAGAYHLHPACWDACLHVLGGDEAARGRQRVRAGVRRRGRRLAASRRHDGLQPRHAPRRSRRRQRRRNALRPRRHAPGPPHRPAPEACQPRGAFGTKWQRGSGVVLRGRVARRARPAAAQSSISQWLVVADRGGVAAAATALLGGRCVVVWPGTRFERLPADSSGAAQYRLDVSDGAQWTRLLEEAFRAGQNGNGHAAPNSALGVVHLGSLDATLDSES